MCGDVEKRAINDSDGVANAALSQLTYRPILY
jgi:hypothetical protein